MSPHDSLNDLYYALGYKRLNRTWARIEIILGLINSGVGLMLIVWSLNNSSERGLFLPLAGGLCLWVLGQYLALAGNRSFIYQSCNELTAYLPKKISQDAGTR